jgi:gliding motility-associated-like protein
MKQLFYFLILLFITCTAVPLIAQPANDSICNSQALGTLPAPPACTGVTGTKKGVPVTVSGTNVNATPEFTYPYNPNCAPNLTNPPADVWYSFVASSYQTLIAITGATFTNPIIAVYEGTCTGYQSIGCASGTGGAATLTVIALTPGNTYWVQVSGLDATQTGTYTLKFTSETDCANCLIASTASASPPPTNGYYKPNTTVTFCDSIYSWNQTSSNWLHGVQWTFGAGWNAATIVTGTPPSSCSQDGGSWAWYAGGTTSSATGTHWGQGFYYETSSGANCFCINGNPGDNYGDNDASNTCTWKFCVTITTNSACTPGSDLDVSVGVSGDGQSGSWTSVACNNDPITHLYAVGSCCPPNMTSTAATCANANGGSATATAVGTYSPWTFTWSNGTTVTNSSGSSTITGLAMGTDTVTVTDALNCTVSATVSVGGPTGVSAGPAKTVTCATLPGGSATMGATGIGTWTAQAGNPGTASITTASSPTTTITNFSAPGVYTFIWTVSGCPATTTVTVTAKPNAGAAQIVSCAILPGGTATMATTGAGTWTAQAGNPGTAVITTPTTPTTTITTFSAAGTYTFIWTNASGCTATTTVTVTAGPNAGAAQTVNCVALPGGSATMAATGVGTWSAQAGNPGTATISTPTSPTTTITTFSAAGIYTFIWANANGCTATTTVTVTALPNAGVAQTVTCVTLPGGSATMAATGTGTWTAQAGNPGTATITTPASPTTTITTFSVAGIYTFIWTNAAGCAATTTVTVTAQPNAGAAKTVSCIVLPGGSATMAATGTGTWSAQAGNPGTETITTPTSPTTTITTFSAAGTYTFNWTNGTCTATTTVTVSAKPNAGPDQTLNCIVTPGGSVTMAATGAGTWTAWASNPGTATITTPTNPTTTITTFSQPGTYQFIWASGGCTDTASVIITSKPNAGADQTILCAMLPGGSATLAAIEPAAILGVWSAAAGNPGTATITTPNNHTTTITTFSAPGIYYFVWTQNISGCTDTATVTVTAKPNAGPDQTVNCAALPGGTATMAGIGTGTWTAQIGNPGTATITTPTSSTTTITTFTAAGTYTFIWTNGSCPDTANIVVTALPDAGPAQSVSCTLLPGGSATMAGTGTGTWTAQAGNPGTATITTPTSPTTTITTFSAAGTYTFIWTNAAGCTATTTVTVAAQPNAGVSQTVNCVALPGGTATMAATTTPGTWSAQAGNPGTATITNPASPTTTITTYSAAGIYTFIWTNGACTSTTTVTVTALPNAGAAQTVLCATLPGGTATMAATGTGTWSAQAGNPGTAVITTPTSPSTIITTFSAAGTYTFIWTNASGCTATTTVTVTAQPNAGAAQTVNCVTLPGGSATMAATTTPGTWSAQAGNPSTAAITTPASPTTTITTFSAAGTYTFIWTNGTCTSTTTVTVTALPDAGAAQTVSCAVLPGGTATMAAVGTGTWTAQAGNPGTATITTPTSPSTTITTFSTIGTYTFVWTNGSGCTATTTVTVTAKPDAGPDQIVTCYPLAGAATMAATGAGSWSAQTGNPGTATITTPTSPSTTISNFSAAGLYYFIWTNASGCTDTATIDVTTKPNAGPDKLVTCAQLPGGSATMAASGSGTWSPLVTNPGTATITNPSSPTTTITNFSAAGTYSFIWTISTCSDTANVTVTAKPNAGTDQTVSCAILPGGTATMSATGAGTWTAQTGNPGNATITNTTDPLTTITTFTIDGTYYFIWTNASGCSDTTAIIVTAKPNAGADQSVSCAILPGGTATMAATGIGTWSDPGTNPGTSVINSPGSASTTISTFTVAGTYSYIWTNADGCTDTANIIVTAKPDAGPDQTVSCALLPGGSATMAATNTGVWIDPGTNPGTSIITNQNDPLTTITTFSTAGVYSYIWTNAAQCTDTVTVTVTAQPGAGPDQTVACVILPGGSATMAAMSTGTWTDPGTNPGTSTITNPTSATTTITNFSMPGTYSYTWTNAAGCTDIATVIVTQRPIVSLGSIAICAGQSTTLTGIGSPPGGTYLWSTGAAGNTILVTPATTSNFTVTYTLGTCSSSTFDTVTVNSLPIVTVSTNPAICTSNTGMAIANVSSGTPNYIYTWSSPGGVQDTLANLPIGTYTVSVTDVNGCSAFASDTVSQQTSTITVNEVSQHDLKCFNDGTGAIYISPVDNAGGANSYTYSYNWGAAGSTQNLTGLQIGTYTVTVTDQFGCTGTGSYTLAQPVQLTGTTSEVNPTCFGQANGSATVTPSGGSGNYHYAWNTSPAQNTDPAISLASGTYIVSVTDDSLCLATFSVTLTDPAQITFGAPTITDPSCFNSSNGAAQIAPQNGIGSYMYAWGTTPVQNTNPATGLIGGAYTVTATDANGCTAATTVTLVTPSQLNVAISGTNLNCYQSSNGTVTASVSGGTPPYSYSWNNEDSTATINSLPATTYTVTATDANGCPAVDSTTLTQPGIVSETLGSVRTNCTYTSDGQVLDTAYGGTQPFTFTLDDATGAIVQSGNTTGTFSNVAAGLYTVIATDANGCPVSDTITVPLAPFNYYTDTAVSTSCYGPQYSDGIIHLQGYSIPNGPFQYAIDGGSFSVSPDFFGLSAGLHKVTAQDAYGCDTTFNILVPEPQPAVVQILPGDSTITAGTTLQLSTVFGPYSADSIRSYSWVPGTGMSCIDCPSPQVSPYANSTTYTVIITYNQGCTASASVQIDVNGEPPFYIPNAFSPNGDGTNDVWYVYGTGVKDVKAMIFDRWGEKVFETDNQSTGWDGTYRGQMQAPGVFVYIVTIVYLDGQTDTKQGSLTLIR